MYENSTEDILKAKNGDNEIMTKLIQENNRATLEHCKTFFTDVAMN